MKQQKIEVVLADRAESVISKLMNSGWRVISVTAEHVSLSSNHYNELRGLIVFILEKEELIDEKQN